MHQHSSGARMYACLYVCVCVYNVCSTVCRLYVSVHDACVSAGIQGSSQEQKCSVRLTAIGLDKNPGAIWEAMTTSETMYGHTPHTEGGVGVSESLTRGMFSHTNHRQLRDWRKALKCCRPVWSVHHSNTFTKPSLSWSG